MSMSDRGTAGNSEYLSLLRPHNVCMDKIGESRLIGFGQQTGPHGSSLIYDKPLSEYDRDHFDFKLTHSGEDVLFRIRLPVEEVPEQKLPDEEPGMCSGIPPLILRGLRNYGLHHIRTGSFLQAVLENNLIETLCRGDSGSNEALPHIVNYVYNALPSQSWGSKEKVEAWIKSGDPS